MITFQQRGAVADIAPDVVMGDDSVIWSFAVICQGVRIGAGCAIGSGVYIGRGTVLGDQVRVQDKCHLTDRMVVGNRVFFGPCVVTINDKYPRVGNADYVVDPPTIEDDVSIGGGAVILPGVTLGRGCVIGAGAVVTKSVPAGETWVGNPAHPLRQVRPTSSLVDDLNLVELIRGEPLMPGSSLGEVSEETYAAVCAHVKQWPDPPADGGWIWRQSQQETTAMPQGMPKPKKPMSKPKKPRE